MDASASSEKTATIRRCRAISCSLSEVGKLLLWETTWRPFCHCETLCDWLMRLFAVPKLDPNNKSCFLAA